MEGSGDGTARQPDERELRVPSGADLVLGVRGPELFAADRRVLASFADAAAGALHGRRVAQRAAEAAQLEAADRMRSDAAGRGRPRPAHAAGGGQGRGEQPAPARRRLDRRGDRASCWPPSRAGADRLQALVGNLLDASRLQAGAVSTLVEPVRLEELVGRALLERGSLEPRGAGRSPRTCPTCWPTSAWPSGCWPTCWTTPSGTAAGRAWSCAARRRTDRVRCDVVDHGPGRAGRRRALFAPFNRLDGHGPGPLGDRAAGGLGLGLAVARGFAEAMGGTLDAAADARRRADRCG